MASMINIITADDHPLIRKGIKHILSKTADMRIVDEAEDGRQLLKKLRSARYDFIFLDITMPGMDIFQLLREIKQLTPDIPILVLSMLPEEQFGLQLLKAGVNGYLNKSSDLNNLVNAVQQILAGQKYISPALADKLAEALLQKSDAPRHELLSEREFQVLCLIAKGVTVSEIAEQLFLSVKTISTYRSRILAKLDLDNSAQLTYYAIQNRLV
jgi:DNA-binding NarL/FixJ family response regulator